MAVRQYVGARYVPKFADPVAWQSGTSYEALTIVTYNNSSYTSKIPVPATVGNPADNDTYWALTGNYNAQVEAYREETVALQENLNETNQNLANEVQAREEKNSDLQSQINRLFILFEDYGAVGDGVTDDSDAIQNTFNAASESGLEIKGLNKTYLISKNLELPKNVGLRGNSSKRTIITSNNIVTINVTGGADDNYEGYIENIYFNHIQLSMGNTTSDYGNGYTVRNCRFRGVSGETYNAITLANNCWNMLFENINFRVCTACITCNFTDAINSGARIIMDNITGSDGTNGLVVHGHTTDGGDIKLSNWNLEHMAMSILCDNDSSGNYIYAYNGHCESNTAGLAISDGAVIIINGGWFYINSTGTVATATGNASIAISHCRLNGQWSKYFVGNVTIGEEVYCSLNNFIDIGSPNTAYKTSSAQSYYLEKTLSESYTIHVNNTNSMFEIDGLLSVPGGSSSTGAFRLEYASHAITITPTGNIVNVGGFIGLHLFIWHRSITGYYIVNDELHPIHLQYTAGSGTNDMVFSDANANKGLILAIRYQPNYNFPNHFVD